MKVALVYDRVNKFGGAERVMQSLHKIYPKAPLYTLVHNKETAKWADNIKVLPTFLNRINFIKRRHEWLAPIAPLAFETFDFSGFDVIISVTSSDAKSVITKPNQLHICYCLTPTRYFWSGEGDYSSDGKMRFLPKTIKNYLRIVDLLISKRPDMYVAISKEVKKRIFKYYHRESSVIYPSIEQKFFTSNIVPKDKRDYYLHVGRMVSYKKADLIVDAFNQNGKQLVMVGVGSEKTKLERKAKKNITFAGSVDDIKLIELYRHAKALIFPQEEDFGLVPIEAQATGTPVIAYGQGGALETIINAQTGLFFSKQTTTSLNEAVSKFEKTEFNYQDCVDNAKKFSDKTFSEEFKNMVDAESKRHFSRFR